MATQSPPLVALQAPKDISLSEIEAELTLLNLPEHKSIMSVGY